MFKVGDLVEWAGAPGKVIKDYKFKCADAAPLEVEFEARKPAGSTPGAIGEHHTEMFGYDGRLRYWHKEPSLKFRK